MVARGGEGIGDVFEEFSVVVFYWGGFAVHYAVVDAHFGVKNMGDALVSEANAQNRHFPGVGLDNFVGLSGFFGSARAGRDQDSGGV